VTASTSTTSSPTAPVSDPETVAVERVPWSILGPEFIRSWGYPRGEQSPEHIEIMGQTGSGKSYFETFILLQRQRARKSHIVVIATKPADRTLLETGWPVVSEYPPRDPRETAVIYWPHASGLDSAGQREQARKIFRLLQTLWHPDANIIVVFDEIAYVCTDLNYPPDIPMKTAVMKYLREGRALGITVVASTQRPQGVPRQMHSESGWTVCFAPKDEEDAERMAQVLGGKKTYMPILRTLNREAYEFLIVHGLTGKMYISWIDEPMPEPLQINER
jgi:DNA helicase HerA-like ATPase